jgi:hypothetical protein
VFKARVERAFRAEGFGGTEGGFEIDGVASEAEMPVGFGGTGGGMA